MSKTFASVIYKCLQYARGFIPGRPFQPNLKFVSNAGAYLSEDLLGVPLLLICFH